MTRKKKSFDVSILGPCSPLMEQRSLGLSGASKVSDKEAPQVQLPGPSISSMRHLVIRLVETSFVPFSYILVKSCFPRSSMKLTLVKSTKSAAWVDEACCQHLSNSSTQAPANFPSRTSRVVADSL